MRAVLKGVRQVAGSVKWMAVRKGWWTVLYRIELLA